MTNVFWITLITFSVSFMQLMRWAVCLEIYAVINQLIIGTPSFSFSLSFTFLLVFFQCAYCWSSSPDRASIVAHKCAVVSGSGVQKRSSPIPLLSLWQFSLIVPVGVSRPSAPSRRFLSNCQWHCLIQERTFRSSAFFCCLNH